MGAGKSTLGPELARRLGRAFVSTDALVEVRTGVTVAELFAESGEAAFREVEEQVAREELERRTPAVVELGGGALGSEDTRRALAESSLTLLLETTPDEAWERVAGSRRPLAEDPERFRALYEERSDLYAAAADGHARDLDSAVLAAAGIRLAPHAEASGEAIVADEHVAELHGIDASHVVPRGEAAKTVAEAERLWRSLRLERESTLVAVGGGSTTDLVGFVAATHLRSVSWIAVPTTLVGQVDAAIGGKTAIDLPEGKNLVGAFHWPARTVIDTSFLETLPPAELENGRAEVVKTGLLAGEPLWEPPLGEQVRRCAAFKAAVCLRDPLDRGERAQLNLGHTFAHALEAASAYSLPHGRAVALGLLAALRLSGLDELAHEVQELLHAEPVTVDREHAWAALTRDKKRRNGRVQLVLLESPGAPRLDVEIPEGDLRRALAALIQ
ncbi:MAG TPA: bifunctional shikimate kinase/3-dehydroquinate synthase [Gaiellaceae bacterium]|nr:bifunctional shikimate kinase/3-dehydroquinate synthase [Gaiellaceae bacterium]